MHYKLNHHLHAAQYGADIIVLDLNTDTYFTLTGKTAEYLKKIVSNPVTPGTDQELDAWAHQLLQRGMIIASDIPQILYQPLETGGLSDYRWDRKSTFASLKKSPKILVIQAFFMIHKVQKLIKKGGIKAITAEINKQSRDHRSPIIPTEKEIATLSDAIDAASTLYPKKIFCLAWAAVFTLMALKKNWKCSFTVGVQAMPFYAHAWAEINGHVINDDPQIQKKLAIILQKPDFK